MRTLNLKKETISELSSDELVTVLGASFPSKYDCTESYQVCNPLSREHCINVGSLRACLETRFCIPTQTC